MYNSIWKFPLGQGTDQGILMPSGAEIISAQIQGDQICVWAKVDGGAPTSTRRIAVFGTGWNTPIPPEFKFIATVQMGHFVWHIFDGGQI